MEKIIIKCIKTRRGDEISKLLSGKTQNLDLSNGDLTDEDLSFVLKCISKIEIRKLWLNGNRITGKGMKYLAEYLSNIKTLFFLNLGRNKIDLDGLTTLFKKGLRNNDTLISLRLYEVFSESSVEKQAKILSEYILENKSLLILDISSNFLTKKSFPHLLEALLNNDSVTFLQLRNNGIGDIEVMGFMEVLESHKSLSIVDLTNNKITNRGARMILDVLEVKKSIIDFMIWGNNISNIQLIQHEIQEKLNRNAADMFELKTVIQFGDFKSFQILVKNGTNLFHHNIDGEWNNIFHLIVKFNRKTFLQFLVRELPENKIRNLRRYLFGMKNVREQGKTALELTKEVGRTWFMDYLRPKKKHLEEIREKRMGSAKENWNVLKSKVMKFF